ncbi:MAG: hypothetical protein RBS25_04320 [Bacilli bacterium]|nr:hypothetical protein [Bacilli bacterium]
MNKNAKVKKHNLKLISFWSIIGLVSVAFLTIIIVMFVELRPIESYEDIREAKLLVYGNQLFTQPEVEYYVYIYDSSNNDDIDLFKAEQLKPIIFNYFNFVKENKRKDNVVNLYGLDVRYPENSSCVSNVDSSLNVTAFESFTVKESNLPMLIHIYQGAIEHRKITANDIQSELQNAMDRVTLVSNIAILPRKEDIILT